MIEGEPQGGILGNFECEDAFSEAGGLYWYSIVEPTYLSSCTYLSSDEWRQRYTLYTEWVHQVLIETQNTSKTVRDCASNQFHHQCTCDHVSYQIRSRFIQIWSSSNATREIPCKNTRQLLWKITRKFHRNFHQENTSKDNGRVTSRKLAVQTEAYKKEVPKTEGTEKKREMETSQQRHAQWSFYRDIRHSQDSSKVLYFQFISPGTHIWTRYSETSQRTQVWLRR